MKVMENGNERKGKFIVFEGLDGSGKTTQMWLLSEYLESRDVKCFSTHEPTDSAFGKLLKDCLTGKIDTDEKMIAALFAADRLGHITGESGMANKLAAGRTVLCDRYYFSSFAYNGEFVPFDWVVELNSKARELLKPDLVIFIDLPSEESMKRVNSRTAQERYETEEKQQKIRTRFFEAFERFPDENVVIIQSEADKYETQEKIRKVVAQLYGWE